MTELDALMSLAAHALGSDTTMCRPELLRYDSRSTGPDQSPLFEAVGLVHPSGIEGLE